MSTLLISGCSYGLVYSEIVEELKTLFSVDEVINLSSAGTSPDRQIRVVIEWIAQNGNPDMVIMPVSHHNRFDLPIAGILIIYIIYIIKHTGLWIGLTRPYERKPSTILLI